MASYDHPAFLWTQASKDIEAASAAGDFQNADVTQASVLAEWASWVNAFPPTGAGGGSGGGAGGAQSYPTAS